MASDSLDITRASLYAAIGLGLVIGLPIVLSLVYGDAPGMAESIPWFWSGAADALSGVAGFAVGSTSGFVLGIFGFLILVTVFWLTRLSGASEEGRGGSGTPFTNALKAFFFVLFLVPVFFFRDLIQANLWNIGIVLLLAFAGYIAFKFMQSDASRTRARIRRTQREVGKDVESWAQVAAGVVLIGVSVVFSATTGIFAAIGSLDQFITPLMNEIGFGILALVGYDQLGGTFMGSNLIPSMNAMQWLGLCLVTVSVVLVFRDN